MTNDKHDALKCTNPDCPCVSIRVEKSLAERHDTLSEILRSKYDIDFCDSGKTISVLQRIGGSTDLAPCMALCMMGEWALAEWNYPALYPETVACFEAHHKYITGWRWPSENMQVEEPMTLGRVDPSEGMTPGEPTWEVPAYIHVNGGTKEEAEHIAAKLLDIGLGGLSNRSYKRTGWVHGGAYPDTKRPQRAFLCSVDTPTVNPPGGTPSIEHMGEETDPPREQPC